MLEILRRFWALLALVSITAGQGCLDPIEDTRVCDDHGGEAYAKNAYDPAVYHPCGRECRAGNPATYRCQCSRSCPCWDYH
ncbi:MAG TPA: hypothetical protein VMU54_10010 [Planctomycetota bacterium]|nr:hypothetical protein [Planctomycetota bacterium]